MNGRNSTLLSKEATRINSTLKNPVTHKRLKRQLKRLWNKRPWTLKHNIRLTTTELWRLFLNQDVGTLSAQ